MAIKRFASRHAVVDRGPRGSLDCRKLPEDVGDAPAWERVDDVHDWNPDFVRLGDHCLYALQKRWHRALLDGQTPVRVEEVDLQVDQKYGTVRRVGAETVWKVVHRVVSLDEE